MESERIRLRRWNEDDAAILFKYASDPELGPLAGWPPHKSIEESRIVIRDIFTNDETWAIELKETGEAIGCMGYFSFGKSNIQIGENDCEVGYWVARPFWNQGICTEALSLMLEYCFEVKKFNLVWADHFVGNPASGRVMQKCGFEYTGKTNFCSHLLGGDSEMVKIYNLTPEKWKKIKSL